MWTSASAAAMVAELQKRSLLGEKTTKILNFTFSKIGNTAFMTHAGI